MTPVEKLSPVNFLSVCDVTMDILEELQMSTKNVITIPLLRTVIRSGFNILMPGGDVNSVEKYCNYRLKAIEYLKANNYIKDFKPSDDNFIFNRVVEITVNKEVFDKFYSELSKVYQKRVVDPAKKELKKKPKPERTDEAKVKIEKVEIIGRDKIEQHGNKDTVKIKNITNNHSNKKRFSINKSVVKIFWIIIAAGITFLVIHYLGKIFER